MTLLNGVPHNPRLQISPFDPTQREMSRQLPLSSETTYPSKPDETGHRAGRTPAYFLYKGFAVLTDSDLLHAHIKFPYFTNKHTE